MTDYFQHNATRDSRKEVSLEVIDFDLQPLSPGTAELLAHIARETGRGP